MEQEIIDKIKELKTRILRQGNLSNRVVISQYGDYTPIRDGFLNQIVIDIIDEVFEQQLTSEEKC